MGRAWRLAKAGLRTGQALVVAVSLYQTVVTALGYRLQRRPVDRSLSTARPPRLGLIVCARNESAVVGRLVRDLLDQDYPEELREVLVVAHNCEDDTASVAARSGARVLELQTVRLGKKFAIRAGAESLGTAFDFFGVFDADARVAPGLLRAIADHAAGADCLQAETVPIADADWLAEGYGFGRKARNLFWWRPREALGLSSTITGSGWFIRPDVFAKYTKAMWTLTEDLELTARLVADGHAVRYVSAAQVALGEPRQLGDSMRQRTRWVRGHLGVVKTRWLWVARQAIRGDIRALDLAIFLLFPTRMLTRLGVTAAVALTAISAPFALPALVVWPALAGEWLLPAWIAWRERLIHLSTGSLSVALRHGVLDLLWFPIGAWALVTARLQAWHSAPRHVPEAGRVP
jgi:cellulose synthase/poly-beta-1,6-N-acetylglucosamine synthase-like glycosyltransferase